MTFSFGKRTIILIILGFLFLISDTFLCYQIYANSQNLKKINAKLDATLYLQQYNFFSLKPFSFQQNEISDELELKEKNQPEEKVDKINYEINEPAKDKSPDRKLIHKRGKLPYNELIQISSEVLDYVPHLENKKGFSKLIVETTIAESFGGENYHIANMGGLGIAQFNYKSAKFLLNWLKSKHPEAYKSISSLKDPKLDLRQNLIHNIHFGMAMCGTLYWYYHKDTIYDKTNSLTARAHIWKKNYNTVKGAGTPQVYVKRVNRFMKGMSI